MYVLALMCLSFEPGGHGHDNATGDSRIVGGNDAGIGEYPFFVEWDGCGAALVHNGELYSDRSNSVLTVASMLIPDTHRLTV
jgi:hypothetical protein